VGEVNEESWWKALKYPFISLYDKDKYSSYMVKAGIFVYIFYMLS